MYKGYFLIVSLLVWTLGAYFATPYPVTVTLQPGVSFNQAVALIERHSSEGLYCAASPSIGLAATDPTKTGYEIKLCRGWERTPEDWEQKGWARQYEHFQALEMLDRFPCDDPTGADCPAMPIGTIRMFTDEPLALATAPEVESVEPTDLAARDDLALFFWRARQIQRNIYQP